MVDLRLLHALQIEPRASWADLARVVGADAAHLSRRWARLRSAGVAWVTGIMDFGLGTGLALIEVECSPGHLRSVAGALAEDPEVLTLDVTLGGRDLLVTVAVDTEERVASYVLDRLSRLAGVRAVRTHLVTERILDARRWRLRELSDDDVARIPPPRPPRARAARQVSPELTAIIRTELAQDGRATPAAIAASRGLNPQQVADAIATLRASGALYLRTDIVRTMSAWPVYTWYFVQVPAQEVARARSTLRQVPEIRLAVLCASRYNLILAVWLRSMSDVHAFEAALARAVEGIVVVDRSVVVRVVKHLGHLLDRRGRATGRVVTGP